MRADANASIFLREPVTDTTDTMWRLKNVTTLGTVGRKYPLHDQDYGRSRWKIKLFELLNVADTFENIEYAKVIGSNLHGCVHSKKLYENIFNQPFKRAEKNAKKNINNSGEILYNFYKKTGNFPKECPNEQKLRLHCLPGLASRKKKCV